MKRWMGWMTFAVLLAAPLANRVEAEDACVTAQGRTTCTWGPFQRTLAAAQTIRADYSERDKMTGSQLKDMIKKLGKQVAKDGETADLTVTIQPATLTGVDIGPADEEILELRIYSGNNTQQLAWVETYVGQKDRPWPANVNSAIQQFLHRLPKK